MDVRLFYYIFLELGMYLYILNVMDIVNNIEFVRSFVLYDLDLIIIFVSNLLSFMVVSGVKEINYMW